ncbi:hypothetical protein BZG36_00888 [Bifiguratus adelaidae]|uniref:UDP-N-acetylglucosamine diphosphorylase n=1 Tax=Bifiguratus adelaidae TaxID=1938954 RepID=A0A261Y5E6_9FUNG|nr:hypothetical protein BZG36_00888 [Bifiguratus adelaidae]
MIPRLQKALSSFNLKSTPSNKQVAELKQKYAAAGQGHLFTFYEELTDEEKCSLFDQLSALDVERVNKIYQKAMEGSKATETDAQLEALPDNVFDSVLNGDPAKLKEWWSKGLSLIAEGKVAVILMAGGQGTRLGSSAPKGCYDVELPSHKYLFQLQAERILKVQELARQYAKPAEKHRSIVPWYIMTSGPTHQATVSFFEKHEYFGLDKANVTFFEQGTLPCLTMDGKILLDSKSQVAVAPDGNGGIYAALQNKGIIKSLKQRGIEYSHCYCVDNCLARVADPVFIGYCVSKDIDCGVKTVRKLNPEEAVGVVCLRNGKYGVVEYSEISKEMAELRNDRGELAFGAGNIANHFYTTAFLERVQSFEDQLEYHIAKKKIKHTELTTGKLISPTTPNGMKMELFVFDVFPFAERLAVLEVDRRDEFSPLKNAPGSGSDCPETSRRDIIAQHVRFIEKAGGKVVSADGALNFDTLQFEISPWVSYAGEGLDEVVKGESVHAPCVIETMQDLHKAVV